MDIFSLTCFLKLAESTRFYRAAEEAHISQSSFSKHIQTLEQELGATLFLRNRDGSELTEAGKALLPYAAQIVSEYENSVRLVDTYKKAIFKRLDIYTHSFLSDYRISDLLFRFQEQNPDIRMEIHEVESALAIQTLHLNPSVICITFSEVGSEDESLIQLPLCYDDLVLLVNRQSEYAGLESVSLSALRDVAFVTMRGGQESFLYAFIFQQCRKAGFLPRPSRYELWVSSLAELVQAQGCVSILPRRLAESIMTPEIVMLPIKGAERISVQLIRNRHNSSEGAERVFTFMRENPLT